jgi:DDE superfamily endonuclease/Helix-turn-helix of DDE superfamily endonuclease
VPSNIYFIKSELSQSPLSSAYLRHHPKRFERIIGLSVEQFDHLVQRVDQHRLDDLLARQVLWDAERTERLHKRTNNDLAEHVCITLLYQRQYMMQEVLGACFGIEQGSVSNIIARIEPWLEASLPTPEALSNRIADTVEKMPPEQVETFSVVIIGDGAEQAKQRPQNAEEQHEDYSGKKKLHTHKVQVLGTPTGLILGLSPTAGGSVHDFQQWKGFRLNEGLRRIVLLMGNRVIGYFDSAYQSIAKRHYQWTIRLQQKAFVNKPLTEAQKTTNRVRSKVRIAIEHSIRRIKISRSCADRGRKTTKEKHQRRWQIAAGIANLRLIHSSTKPELKVLWA